MSRKKLFLLDVLPLLYRAHFAMINQSLVNAAGLNTAPTLGFCNYLFQIIFKEKPTHIAAAFDSYSKERKASMTDYKANREKAPEDILLSMDYVRGIIDALNIPRVEVEGFEADDVIGTLAIEAEQEGFDVYMVTPDKDFAQLVNEHIFLYKPPYKGFNFELLDINKVEEKYGVPPEQIADLLALKGDPVDNIPGVPKIGEKTAIDLLKKYGCVELLLERKEEVEKVSIRESLIANEETAKLSKSLATINVNVPVEFSQTDFLLKAPDFAELERLLDELEFKKLKERILANPLYKDFLNSDKKEKAVQFKEEFKVEVKTLTNEAELDDLLSTITDRMEIFFKVEVKKDFHLYIDLDNTVFIYKCERSLLPDSLKTIFENDRVEKVSYDFKPLYKIARNEGFEFKGPIFDILVAHYLIKPEGNHQLINIKAQLEDFYFSEVLAPEDVLMIEVLSLKGIKERLSLELVENNLKDLYYNLELPLIDVLAQMEENGITIDTKALAEISRIFNKKIGEIEEKIYSLAGEKINLKSSKQTGDLFSRLMPEVSIKKTKTGQISTAEASLEALAGEYEIAGHMLTFRKLTKLVSTYTESLPTYINAETGRVHADFRQTSTATGRLSCINPNLQNLPIRTEEGREVRKAVVPSEKDYIILSADYSQIELRLLAALSNDPALTEAFATNKDIHTITAARVFHVAEDQVTDDMRSKAKMVNYGIAYGISAFGLSQRLKIKMAEAKEIIDHYFGGFPSIKSYIDSTIEKARELGYTETLTGRKRPLPDITSRNGTVRKMAERIAINAPLQGLAADIIKVAMIEIQKYINENRLKTKMILQVHDELVFEVYQPELEEIKTIVREKMETAIPLPVPIEVNLGIGENWLDLEEVEGVKVKAEDA